MSIIIYGNYFPLITNLPIIVFDSKFDELGKNVSVVNPLIPS